VRAWWSLCLVGCWLPDRVVADKIAAGPDPDPVDDSEPVLDTELDSPVHTDVDSDIDSEVDSPVDTEVVPPECADEILLTSVGHPIASGNTTVEIDDFQGTCADQGGAGDTVLAWHANHAGCYVFSLLDSQTDSVMYLLDACDGTELACNDDVLYDDAEYTSEIHYQAQTGEDLLIVVDAYSGGSEGPWNLDVIEGTAAPVDDDLGTATGDVVSGNNQTADTTLDPLGDCGADSIGDVLYTWTAPSSGRWRISNVGTDFDAVLSVHRRCEAFALDCSDSVLNGDESVSVNLDARETIVIRVASAYSFLWGYERGDFSLQVVADL
jgi:hypothetical protein